MQLIFGRSPGTACSVHLLATAEPVACPRARKQELMVAPFLYLFAFNDAYPFLQDLERRILLYLSNRARLSVRGNF